MWRVAIVSTVLACGCVDPIEEDLEGEEAALAGQPGEAFTYYWIVAEPLGGQVVARVNRGGTVCAEGTMRPYCPVAALDTSGLDLRGDDLARLADRIDELFAVIVRGRLELVAGAPRLVATEVWLAGLEDRGPAGVGVRVEQTGIRCVQWPCADKTELRLNVGTSTHIAELDFAPSGASDDQIAVAMDALTLEGGEGLLVFGDRYLVCNGGATARARTVTQFYTRLDAPLTPVQCEAMGGVVRPDLGDGQVRCGPDETDLGRVLFGIEGGVCCAP